MKMLKVLAVLMIALILSAAAATADADEYTVFAPYWGVSITSCNGLYGLADEAGNEIVSPVYDAIGSFDGGFALAWKNEKAGLLAPNGEELLPCTYEDLIKMPDSAAHGIIAYVEDELYGIMNIRGQKLTEACWSNFMIDPDGKIRVEDADTFLWGCLDADGHMIAQPVWAYIEAFSEGFAAVYDPQTGRQRYVDESGVASKDSFQGAGSFQNGTAVVVEEDGAVSLVDSSLRRLWTRQGLSLWIGSSDASWMDLAFHGDLLAAKDLTTGKWGFLDLTGNWVIEPAYDDAVNGFDFGICSIVRQDHKAYFINRDGVICSPVYDASAQDIYHGCYGEYYVLECEDKTIVKRINAADEFVIGKTSLYLARMKGDKPYFNSWNDSPGLANHGVWTPDDGFVIPEKYALTDSWNDDLWIAQDEEGDVYWLNNQGELVAEVLIFD